MPLRKRAQKRTQKRTQKRIQKRTQKRSSKRLKPQKSLIKRIKGGEGNEDEWDKLDECKSEITKKERLKCKIEKTNNQELKKKFEEKLKKLELLEYNIQIKKNKNKIYEQFAIDLCQCDNNTNKNEITKQLKEVEIFCTNKESRANCGNLLPDGTPDPLNVIIMFLKIYKHYVTKLKNDRELLSGILNHFQEAKLKNYSEIEHYIFS